MRLPRRLQSDRQNSGDHQTLGDMVSHLVRVILCLCLFWAPGIFAELPAEPIPNVLKLETPYPPTYAMVHDFAFGGLIDSKFGLVDTNTRRFKGMISAGQFATLDYSVARQKFYVG